MDTAMILNLFRRRGSDEAIYALYGEIVSQARQPVFYTAHGVPDTVEGRFDMILLHLILVFKRLEGEPPETVAIGQKVLDLFFTDMDRSIREMGVGDLAVPKKMKKLGEAYAGRSAAYGPALSAADAAALATGLARNVWIDAAPEGAAEALAAYALAAFAALAAQPAAEIIAGRPGWIAPAPQA
jgi:cytochrome b pre-mRNA-processing protein 3